MTLRTDKRRGVVLIIVLVVVTILLLIGYQYLNLMNAENSSAVVSGRLAQSRHLADSGVHYASFVLAFPQTMNLSDTAESYRPWSGLLYDNHEAFHYRPINGPNGVKGYFSIVALRDPLSDEMAATQGYRFGVEDENGKINLNAARKLMDQDPQAASFIETMIKAIPTINEEQATAVLNWTKAGGTEDASYYSGLGYTEKMGPYDSTDELLMVKGWTPRQLYGNDRNRNGRLDPEEDDGTGQVDYGLQKYFTTYSRELNVDSTGQQRINLMQPDLNQLKTQLDAAVGTELSTYLVLARCIRRSKMPTSGTPLDLLTLLNNSSNLEGPPAGVVIQENRLVITDFTLLQPNQNANITSLWDLVDTYVACQQGQQRGAVFSPFMRSNKDQLRNTLNLLLDKCTLTDDYEIPARININTCPADVLTAMGVNATDAEKLVQYRPSPDMDPSLAPYFRTPAWLVTEAELQPSVIMLFEKYITTYSQVYRFQVVGYSELAGPQVRIEAVVDTNNGRPRILHWRDLTDLGKGYRFTQSRGSFVP
jgi:type II secretory pathway component PulK